MYRFTILVCLVFLVLFTSLALADIPKLINYQGMLTNDSGEPLTGMYDITFKIYNASSGGDKRWEETQTDVAVTDGLFNVILGGTKVGGIDLDFSEEYWLDITVGAEHMPERLRFTSVGYAYRSQKADTADYALSSPSGPGDYTWTFRITDGGDTTISSNGGWGICRHGNTLYGNADSTHVNLGIASTTGRSGQNLKYCTVGGGFFNSATGGSATTGGGFGNSADTSYATVGGGWDNAASGVSSTVAGGHSNIADESFATVGGGYDNTASGRSATVGGGYSNSAGNNYATVAGGRDNTASGYSAAVGGGRGNIAGGNYSFACGRRANAIHSGTLVWADTTDADFTSTGNNQFLIRASGGVGIGTNSPDERLHVENAAGDNSIKVSSASACTSSIKMFESNDYGFELAYAGNDDKLHLWSRKFSGNEGIRMTWLKDGRVGIGTTDPERDLHIAASGRTEIALEKTNEPTNKWHMGIYEEDFYITETGVGTWMTLKNGGNVGIRTANPHSGLQVEGSMAMAIKHVDESQANTYYVGHEDRVILAESSGFLCVVLPSAAGIAGRIYTIKAIASWVWILPYTSSQKIDGWSGTGVELDSLGFVTLVSDGSNWWIISMHNASFY